MTTVGLAGNLRTSYRLRVDHGFQRRLVIVDDDPLMSRLLRDALEGVGFEVDAAPSAAAARRILREFDPDIALVDLELGGGGPSGVDLAHLIHAEHPGVAVVILTRYGDLRSAGYADDALPSGTGFLRKDLIEDPSQILAAIDAVVAERAEDARHDRDPARPLAELTPAQLEVLELMAQGYDNDAIAGIRDCSRSSVANLIVGIYGRLGIEQRGALNPRVEAVRVYAAASGLPDRGA